MGQEGLTTRTEGLAAAVVEGTLWCKLSWRSPLTQPQRPADMGAGSSQAKKLPGQVVKALLGKALPSRARPSFSEYQSLPSGSFQKPLSCLHQRVDRRSKKNHSPTVTKTKPHHRKLIGMKKQKVMSQMKGQDKIPKNN